MKAVLLNAGRLNFDGKLAFAPIERAVDLDHYETTEPSQVVDRAQGRQILITKELPLGKEIINRLPASVRLICEAGTGVDNIELEATEKRGVTVCNVPGYSTPAVAQLTMSFILAMSTGMHRLVRSVATGDLSDFHNRLRPVHSQVQEKILGVIGAGAIGRRVIRLARAFDMTVRVHSRSASEWDDEGVEQVTLEELLASSEFVTLHCPLTDDTRHLIRSETISGMKRRPYLINTARGGLVNHEDLASALESGHIAGAALDVQEPEPLPSDHVLWSSKSVILTPHIGWKAIEARQRLVVEVAENIRKFVATGEAAYEVHARD